MNCILMNGRRVEGECGHGNHFRLGFRCRVMNGMEAVYLCMFVCAVFVCSDDKGLLPIVPSRSLSMMESMSISAVSVMVSYEVARRTGRVWGRKRRRKEEGWTDGQMEEDDEKVFDPWTSFLESKGK